MVARSITIRHLEIGSSGLHAHFEHLECSYRPMTTSPSTTAAQKLREEIHNFYWGVWSELGVSGWGRTHNDWAIDPEPLIAFSPSVIASEPRLRDEVIDWCSDNWRHISAVRLRHLLKDNPEEDTDAWGQLAATVNRLSGSAKWPRATSERDFTRTGRSSLRPLSEGSMIYLRMRSIFGLTARTEILRYLLFTGERSTAAMLATQVNYAKRNVAEACESLSRARTASRQADRQPAVFLAGREQDAVGLPRALRRHPPGLGIPVSGRQRTLSVDRERDIEREGSHGPDPRSVQRNSGRPRIASTRAPQLCHWLCVPADLVHLGSCGCEITCRRGMARGCRQSGTTADISRLVRGPVAVEIRG